MRSSGRIHAGVSKAPKSAWRLGASRSHGPGSRTQGCREPPQQASHDDAVSGTAGGHGRAKPADHYARIGVGLRTCGPGDPVPRV
jgi:hypothetical protein